MGKRRNHIRWKCFLFAGAVLCGMEGLIGCSTVLPVGAAEETEANLELLNKSDDELYYDAVKDAMTVEEEEMLPVISLARGEPYACYEDRGERLLLITYHGEPQNYPTGASVRLRRGDVWVFAGGEMADWYEVNKKDLRDPGRRFRQLFGLSYDSPATYFTAFWVKPQDVIRPAYTTDITVKEVPGEFPVDMHPEYRQWFEDQIIEKYFDGFEPWTRLGYTYDWAGNGTEYGLSEFLIKNGSEVEIAYTCTREEFQDKLEDGSWRP